MKDLYCEINGVNPEKMDEDQFETIKAQYVARKQAKSKPKPTTIEHIELP